MSRSSSDSPRADEILLLMPASGRLTVKGNEITGYVNGLDVANFTHCKQP
jgi:hypothetical protein